MRFRSRSAEWFWINFKIGAFSLGGSGRMLLYQEALVDKRAWLTEDEFYGILTMAQLLPGPSLINLSVYLSRKFFPESWGVAILGLLGLALPGAVLGVLLTGLALLNDRNLRLFFEGVSIGSIVLFFIFIRRMFDRLWFDSERLIAKRALNVCLVCFVAFLSIKQVPLHWILLLGISAALWIEFRGLPMEKRKR